jgi:alpha-beta hydrolase superfamily lysophospholipase
MALAVVDRRQQCRCRSLRKCHSHTLLVIENGADDAVPPRHLRDTFETAASRDKTYLRVPGASHSYQGQPDALAMVADAVSAWAGERH